MRRVIRVQGVHQDEHGAAAVFVAILVVVLFGFAALAIDVGAMFSERRHLQNGADAGSLAVAQDLAWEIVDGQFNHAAGVLGPPHPGTADYYADANARDGVADVEDIRLDPVESGIPLTNAGEVTVTTLVNDDGSNELQHWFAGVLGIHSSAVRAEASALYAPLGAVGGAFPVVVCDDLHEPDKFVEIEIKVGPQGQQEEVPTDCQTVGTWSGPSPGNFNWLETDGSCEADLEIGDEQEGDGENPSEPGAAVPQDCRDDEEAIRQAIEDYVPGDEDNREDRSRIIALFSTINKSGKGIYTISGLTKFEFTGINLRPGQHQAVISDPSYSHDGWVNEECGFPQSRCVQGFFRGDVLSPGEYDDLDLVPGAQSDLFAVELTR